MTCSSSLKIKIPYHISLYIPLFMIMVLPYLLPYYIEFLLPSWIVRFGFSYLSLICMGIFVLKNHKNLMASMIIVILLYGILVFSSILNDANSVSAIVKSLKVVLLCAIVSIVMVRKDVTWDLVKAVKLLSLFFFLIHILTMILFPHGIPSISMPRRVGYYLYGNVNTTIRYIFTGMCCSSLLDVKQEKISLGTLIFFGGILYQLFMIYNSATTLVALLFVVTWIVFRNLIQSKTKQIYFAVIFIVAVLEILVILLSNTKIMEFITELFDKTTDFSGRYILWENIMYHIRQNPIFGHGLHDTANIYAVVGNSSGSHNYFLDMLYQSGVMGLVAFLILILYPLIKIRNNIDISDSMYIIIGYCLGYLIMFLMEPFRGVEELFVPLFYSLVVLTNKEYKTRILTE